MAGSAAAISHGPTLGTEAQLLSIRSLLNLSHAWHYGCQTGRVLHEYCEVMGEQCNKESSESSRPCPNVKFMINNMIK